MPDQDVIDGLIDGYRDLNLSIRHAYQDVPNDHSATAAKPVLNILRQMRDRELRASQAIRAMLLGNEVAADDEAAEVSIGHYDLNEVSPIVLTSQFGTAREATLAMVRELSDEAWNTQFVTPRGEMTLRAYLQTLVERDRQRINEINVLLDSARV